MPAIIFGFLVLVLALGCQMAANTASANLAVRGIYTLSGSALLDPVAVSVGMWGYPGGRLTVRINRTSQRSVAPNVNCAVDAAIAQAWSDNRVDSSMAIDCSDAVRYGPVLKPRAAFGI